MKNNVDVRGFQATAGSLARLPVAKAQADKEVVSAIRRSHARHIVGKTYLAEFGTRATGLNPWFGDVASPFDTTASAVSSGSAVAVAVSHADIGVGTDPGKGRCAR